MAMVDVDKGVNTDIFMAKINKKKQNRERFMKFWADHPNYTAFVHTTLGMGLGLLAQTFLKEGYVNTLGWLMVFIGVVCNLYPFVAD
jgi:hypothetical protein